MGGPVSLTALARSCLARLYRYMEVLYVYRESSRANGAS